MTLRVFRAVSFDVSKTMEKKYGCAVLAGGQGRRMGQLNKAELKYNGDTFLKHICSEFERLGMKGYISVANYMQDIPEGWIEVRDAVTGPDGGYIGPIAGIYSCLRQAEKEGLDGLFFSPCDTPFFKCEIVRMLSDAVGAEGECDAAVLRTSDGRLQTTLGWYSVRCADAMEYCVSKGSYSLIDVLDRVRTKVIDAKLSGIDENSLVNVNSISDYKRFLCNGITTRHILVCGRKQVGKSTLIRRIIDDTEKPVYGFMTKASPADNEGVRHVYIYPAYEGRAGSDGALTSSDNHLGDVCRKVLNVNTEVFDRLGTALINDAHKDGILIMDELGYMEEYAKGFRNAVLNALDGDIHVLAAIKETEKEGEFLKAVRCHPNAEVLSINAENRDELYIRVRDIVRGW